MNGDSVPTLQPGQAAGLSVVIISYNTRELLLDCLRSVYENRDGLRLEVFVVDNGSADGSVEAARARFPEAVVIANPDNRGFAAANNQAIRLAKGAAVLLLNSDTVVCPGALSGSFRYLMEHPQTGVLGCRLLNLDGSFQSSYFRRVRLGFLVLTHLLGIQLLTPRFLPNELARYWGKVFEAPAEVEVVAGCFFMVRREVIEKTGLLDEEFFFYGEEEEWTHRISRAGWGILYYPLASVYHLHGASSSKEEGSVNMRRLGRKAQLLNLHKQRGWAAAWTGNLIMTAGLILRLPLWGAAAVRNAVAPAGRGAMRWQIIGELAAFHLAGLVRPVWRGRSAPAGARPAGKGAA